MTRTSTKINTAFLSTTSLPSTDQEQLRPQIAPTNRTTLFYGAAHNLLHSIFLHRFAPDIAEEYFYMGASYEDHEPFRFTMMPKPNDTYSENALYECMVNFIREVGNICQEQELTHITVHRGASPHEDALTVRITSETDLMDLLNVLARQYEITMGTYFNQISIPKHPDKQVSFALSPLYSIEHVRALYLDSQGIDVAAMNLGLQLSH